MFSNALILSPHTDDAELGAGGTISRLADNNCKLTMFAFSWCEKKENISAVKQAAKILGIKTLEIFDFKRRVFPTHRQKILQILYDYNKKHSIDLILTPATTDLNQDHQTVTVEATRAFRQSTILGYEMPWNNIQITTNSFVSLTDQQVQKKIDALNCYTTQKDRYYFTEEYFRAILKSRGTQIQTQNAEAFEVIKFVPKI